MSTRALEGTLLANMRAWSAHRILFMAYILMCLLCMLLTIEPPVAQWLEHPNTWSLGFSFLSFLVLEFFFYLIILYGLGLIHW